MLTVYSTSWCPHCKKAIRFLMENHVDFVYKDIEKQPDDVVQPVIEANGGRGWVVPTMEYKGEWRRGKAHNDDQIKKDLQAWGIL